MDFHTMIKGASDQDWTVFFGLAIGPIILFALGVILFARAVARKTDDRVDSTDHLEKRRKQLSFGFTLYCLFGLPSLFAWLAFAWVVCFFKD